jgi:hypothetical protein
MKDNLNIKNKEGTVDSLVETTTQVTESGLSVLNESLPKVSKRGRGRPPKAEVEKKLKPGKRGRPVGDYTKARELCARMLVSEGDRMLKTLINMALTEGHPNQIPALKMCLDRALPISYFESKDGNGTGNNGIVINISGLTPQIQNNNNDEQEVIDVQVTDHKVIDTQ